MNNKGQTTITFILFLPILFMVFGILFDLGRFGYEKRKMDNTVVEVIKYTLNNMGNDENLIKEKASQLLNANIKNLGQIIINISNNNVNIKTIKYEEGIFTGFFREKVYEISSSYYGYIIENEIVINKE